MPNYKLIVEYDGTALSRLADAEEYGSNGRCGARARGNGPVRRARSIDREAGRTDARRPRARAGGEFPCHSPARRDRDQHGINDRLPSDVNVVEVGETDAAFHARHDALTRTYEYRISRVRTAFEKPFVWWVRTLDADTMKAGAAVFAGDHVSRPFCENPEGQTSTRVRVMRCEGGRRGPEDPPARGGPRIFSGR